MAASCDEVSKILLDTLSKQDSIPSTLELLLNGDHIPLQPLLASISSLESRGMIIAVPRDEERWVLSQEGAEIVKSGSHEVKFFNAIPARPNEISLADLLCEIGTIATQIGQGKAFKNKWVGKGSAADKFVRLIDSVEDSTRVLLSRISNNDLTLVDAEVTEMKKRKLCAKEKKKNFAITKGANFMNEIVRQVTDLTAEMIISGSWKEATFKPYNLKAMGREPKGGHLHPLMKVREEFRRIFFEMGFEEMPSNQYVESSFWNFDVLFQPQKHPSRDMHDTFFLKTPSTAKCYPDDVLENVRRVHSVGAYGSLGHRYEWHEAEALKLVLRTHTTAISAQMLHTLAASCGGDVSRFRPAKYFSIDRVFRNETVDATHLAEFHQIEGVVAEVGMSLSHLIGIISVFFAKMGLPQLRFKPAYNPYTEPSLEIFSFHPGLNRWVEVGNSGVFRPEFLRAVGLPAEVGVLGWGLSLERPTMIKYGFNNIRELLGHKVDLRMISRNPICRLEKHK